jgi:hypothetical protein
MKCSVAQTRMLELERPDRPTPALRAHLARCPACQEWFHQFLQMERMVPQIPVPPSTGREQFLQRVLTEPLPDRNGTPLPDFQQEGVGRMAILRRERGMRKMALATGLAAGLILLAMGLIALQPGSDRHDGPRAEGLVKKLLERDLQLASASTAQKRVEGLTALADELRTETRSLAKAPNAADDLATLARLYGQVVSTGIVAQGRKVSAEERGPIVDQLERASREANALAAQSPASAVPLQQIADTARDAARNLKEGQP